MTDTLAAAAFVGVLAYLGMLALVFVSHVVLVLVFGPERDWE